MNPSPRPRRTVAERTRPAARLREDTSGWHLTLSLDENVVAALRNALASPGATVALDDISLSISPNLTPGEPFAVQTVTVEIAER